MDFNELIKKQRAYFDTGVTQNVEFRLEMLRRLKDEIVKREQSILNALKQDLNKTEFEGYMTEVGMVLSEMSYVITHTARWAKPRRVRTPVSQFHARSFVIKEPYGVALILSPWNYPFQLCVEPLIGAIAAGNCAVIKPSNYAPHVSKAVAELIAACFDEQYVAVVQGGREQNKALLDEPFDYILFTGSVAVGKVVMEAASRHLTPVTLELGGKSPVIVDRTANIPLAARRIAFGKVLNAGQTCVAPDYLLIERSAKEAFIQHYIEAVKQFFPKGYDHMPSIINNKHFARLMGLIKGETLLLGGKGDAQRRFIQPTLLDEPAPDAPIMQEEIFGPILPVISVDSVDAAIRYVNARPKPLALYLFTNDKDTEQKVMRACSFGGGCVNDTVIHLATPHMGFGGVGQSGMGSYHGEKSFITFSHEKSIVKKYNWIDLKMRYHPYTDGNFKMLRRFLR